MTVAEVYSGLSPDDRGPADLIFASLEFWEIDLRVAQQAGLYRSQFARRGRQYGVPDMIIGTHALLNDATLLTANERDFPIPGLRMMRLY